MPIIEEVKVRFFSKNIFAFSPNKLIIIAMIKNRNPLERTDARIKI